MSQPANADHWLIEMHCHTVWSKDSLNTFERISRVAERRKIDRILITDHNTAEGALEWAARNPDLFIPGEEIMTTGGELLAWFVKETVPRGLSPQETIQRLRDQGAVIGVAHPFDRVRRGAWALDQLREIVDLVDTIEVFNARCFFKTDNVQAAEFAAQHDKPGTAGSDAHIPYEYGRAMMRVAPFSDAAGLLDSIRSGELVARISPWWVHGGSTTAKWRKRLGLSKRMWEGG
ncbi:MAG: PHP domain-containing protein [Chloroflexi bacterium]|jgi:predicted metal-dependent phosphoesterase TrpH|nr:PHP domain-containing protein [Chloroflexota bacterium]